MGEAETFLYNVQGDVLRLTNFEWRAMLSLAKAHGWTPQGTHPPPKAFGFTEHEGEHPPWDGNYEDAAGQVVPFEDAKRLGEALSAALWRGAETGNRSAVLKLIEWSAGSGLVVSRAAADETIPQEKLHPLSALASALGVESQSGVDAEEIPSADLRRPHILTVAWRLHEAKVALDDEYPAASS